MIHLRHHSVFIDIFSFVHNEKWEHIPTLAEKQYTDIQSQAGWVNKNGEIKTPIYFITSLINACALC